MTEARGRARVFVGLPLEPTLARNAHAEVARALAEDVEAGRFKLTPVADLHLTLVFLGALERTRLAELERPLNEALAPCAAPRLRLTGTGAFPAPGRERVLWIGLEEREHPGRLERCRAAALAAVQRAGIALPVEEHERFHPHVTVARPKEHRRGRRERRWAPESFYGIALGAPWDPPAVVLFESVPAGRGTPEGTPRYQALGRFEFASDA